MIQNSYKKQKFHIIKHNLGYLYIHFYIIIWLKEKNEFTLYP